MTSDFPSGICCLTTLLLLAAVAPGYSQQPVASFYYDERGSVTRQEQDTNRDGKMDRWIYYDSNGQIQRIEQDVILTANPIRPSTTNQEDRSVRKSPAKMTGRSTLGFISTAKAKWSARVKIQTMPANQPCGS